MNTKMMSLVIFTLKFKVLFKKLDFRKKLVHKGIALAQRTYVKGKKNLPWEFSLHDYLRHNEESLGFHIGCFLISNHFEPQPKCEDHDVFHVLTGLGTSVVDEVKMQYLLFGNGKRTLSVFLGITVGFCLYPGHFKQFKSSFSQGKSARKFHHLNYKTLLKMPISILRSELNIAFNS
jgi:hypothetical protein